MIPVLDLQCWVTEAGVIYHIYYEKPMASKYCIMEASAMSTQTKWSSLSQEVIRRMKNTNGRVSHVIRENILTDYMRKLQKSGYPETFRRKILESGVSGYIKMVEGEKLGLGPVNRRRGTRSKRQKRRLGKLREKSEWYKRPKWNLESGGTGTTDKQVHSLASKQFVAEAGKRAAKGQIQALQQPAKATGNRKWEYESVLLVPQTPGGELAAALRAFERKRGALRRIRIVERAGVSLKQKLFSSNPWAREGCARKDCFPCRSGAGEGGVCRRENLTYVIDCITCKNMGKVRQYWGETSRTLYQRGGSTGQPTFLNQKSRYFISIRN
jgi:hypothetical protein